MPAAHAEQENCNHEQQAADDDGLEGKPNDRLLHLKARTAAAAPTPSDTPRFPALPGRGELMRPYGNLRFAFRVGGAAVARERVMPRGSDGVGRCLVAASVLATLAVRPAFALYQEVTCERNFMKGEMLDSEGLDWVRSRHMAYRIVFEKDVGVNSAWLGADGPIGCSASA
jgi:hypothetical protein